MNLSIIIPIYNEEDTISKLAYKIEKTIIRANLAPFEIILIDDGSTDNSWQKIIQISKSKSVLGYKLRKNTGKANALMLGFKKASGKIIITIDGDLQDDPKEIPRFISKINQGFDLVSGWKINRNDPISKTIPSKIFNKIVNLFFNSSIHDINCGFKAYTKKATKHINIYGELHRFIPVLLASQGFKITEIKVKHHHRKFGKSKYNWNRFFKGSIDLLTVLITTRYLNRPGHLFGGIAFVFGLIGSSSLFYLFIQWLIGNRPIGNRPLLFFGILMIFVSVQLMSTGILAELINHKTRKDKLDFLISEKTKN